MYEVAAIVGPTASGKSSVALEVAAAVGGEILSCDSVQIYRGLDIGSGKLLPGQRVSRSGVPVPHHLLDLADPCCPYTAYEYQRDCRRIIREVRARGNLPILCGGTGLYYQAALDDYCFIEQDPDRLRRIRALLAERLEREGAAVLYRELEERAPQTAASLHPHNLRRLLRAWERILLEPGSAADTGNDRGAGGYEVRAFGLTMERSRLYQRIGDRVDAMIGAGLAGETRLLREQGVGEENPKILQTLGYRHMLGYLDGECTLEEAAETMKRDTRRYAKKQLTWFRRDPRIVWLETGTPEGDARAVRTIVEGLETPGGPGTGGKELGGKETGPSG